MIHKRIHKRIHKKIYKRLAKAPGSIWSQQATFDAILENDVESTILTAGRQSSHGLVSRDWWADQVISWFCASAE